MKLWLDDERPIPDESWTLAKTIAEAKDLLTNADSYEWVSLDFTLLPGWDTGLDLLKWMIEVDLIPDVLTVHSSSWDAQQLIIMVAADAGIVATVYEWED